MDAKKKLGSNFVVSWLGAHMVNDNWKSQGPSYQLPARDVEFCLLGRRFSANTQSVSIKIFRPTQILAEMIQFDSEVARLDYHFRQTRRISESLRSSSESFRVP